MIITIDGPSGSGKSTVAKDLAQRLGFNYCDSGAMYRVVAYGLQSKRIDPHNTLELGKFLSHPPFRFIFGKNRPMQILINNQPVGEEIRTAEIATMASEVATIPEIRNFINRLQKEYGQLNDVIFEGRGLGSETFPEADFKFFLTSDINTRAIRRLKELKNVAISLEDVIADLKIRDHRDAVRDLEPLVIPEGALIIDASSLTVSQVIDTIVARINEKTAA
ncbi:MAG: (d)CMP kinase [Victivallaceae bacterium]